MDFAAAVKSGLVKAFTFRGTASRKEYWYFFLFLWILGQFVNLLDIFVNPDLKNSPIYTDPNYLPAASELLQFIPIPSLIVSLITTIPNLAVTYRRIQDGGRPGKLAFLQFIPLVVGIFWLIGFFVFYNDILSTSAMSDSNFAPFLALFVSGLVFLGLQLTWTVFWLIWTLAPTKTAAQGNPYAQQ